MKLLLREGTQDKDIVQEVLVDNSYRLPDRLGRQDVVFDVGAHIGSFAVACLERGAGKVICFEPNRDSFRLLAKNVEPYGDRCVTVNQAVWSCDEECQVLLSDRGSLTGMHFVKAYDSRAVALMGGVPAANLDEWLRRFPRVRILKLDCEGAEYPFLHTTRELGRVQEIIGEIHLKSTIDSCECTAAAVADKLERAGFHVEFVAPEHYPEINNWFFAKRVA